MDRNIKVTGRGNASIKPDLIRLHVYISDERPTYEETIQLSTAMTELVRVSLKRMEFSKDDIKTDSFRVDTVYGDSADGEESEVLRGYRFFHCMIVEFPLDNNKLGGCLTELSKCVARPEYQVSYTVKDKDAVKDMLLGKAVSSARGKAEILAQAAGVSLGALQTIEYSWNEYDLVSSTKPVFSIPEGDHDHLKMRVNIIPKDIVLNDTVTVIWAIK